MCMRTNIEIDEKLIADAMKVLKLKTKKETVHKALQEVIRRNAQTNIANLQGKISFWEGYYED